jgi:hypothetical protein
MHLFDSFNYGGIFYFSCAGLLYLNFAYLMVVLVETTKKNVNLLMLFIE